MAQEAAGAAAAAPNAVIVVERDQGWRDHLGARVERAGGLPVAAATIDEALARVAPEDLVAAVLPAVEGDLRLGDLLARVRQRAPDAQVVVHARGASARTIREVFRLGAADLYDGAAEPPEALVRAVRRAMDRFGVERARRRLLEMMRETGEAMLGGLIEADRRAVEMEEELAGGADEGYRVLVVDDEEGIRALLRRLLRGEGIEVVEAADAAAAERVLREVGAQMAIVDLRLPDRDGLDLAHALRARSPSLEVVVMTAYSTQETALRAVDEAVAAYLTKPFQDLPAIGRRIRGLVSRHRDRMRRERHLRAFRERHREFLQRYAALRADLDRIAREPQAALEQSGPTPLATS